MPTLFRRILKRAAGERGYTLPELLMATMIGLLVVGTGVMVVTAGMRSQPGLTKRGSAISQARFTMERMTRELRQGATVYTANANQLAFITYVHSATCGGSSSATAIPCRVTYTCTTQACTRVEAKPDGTSPGSAVTVVSGLTNSNVFSYAPSSTAPKYVGATFTLAGQNGDDAITVGDGAFLRNPGPPIS
jgi:Tfp pilus assembly protein PilW